MLIRSWLLQNDWYVFVYHIIISEPMEESKWEYFIIWACIASVPFEYTVEEKVLTHLVTFRVIIQACY